MGIYSPEGKVCLWGNGVKKLVFILSYVQTPCIVERRTFGFHQSVYGLMGFVLQWCKVITWV